jgi:DNA uptake protein ComE-like DNA-binding protein
MNAQQAGWYPDPYDGSQMRYWDGSAWTEHRGPRPAPRGPIPQPHTGNWYFIVTLASCGFLASLPFFHAASRLERPRLRVIGAGFAAATILTFALVGSAPEDETGSVSGWQSGLATVVMLAVMLTASLLLIGIRRDVYQSGHVVRSSDRNESARAKVEQARRKRHEARELAGKDPMMARELRIGRPILGTTDNYDDGGLIELNFATAEQLTTVCGLPPAMAAGVVEARTRLGRFQLVEDAITFGQVSEEHAPMVRDRGIVIADHA